MATMVITKEEALSFLEDAIYDEVTDTTRWSALHSCVFKHEGKLWMADYSVGLTEMQDESPWEHEDKVTCTEVQAYERTVTDYRPAR